MYHHDGHDLFVIDGHMHFWDANPENWKNKYGESWIKCFYAYHSALSPADAVWPFEKFCRYGEEALVDDLFRNGYVDMAILNSTYLYEFYKNGFNSPRTTSSRPSTRTACCCAVRSTRAKKRQGSTGFAGWWRSIRSLGLSFTPPSGATARAAGASTTRGPTNI
jgi:hypothetical protein